MDIKKAVCTTYPCRHSTHQSTHVNLMQATYKHCVVLTSLNFA